MNFFKKTLMPAALSAIMLATSIVPSQAFMPAPARMQTETAVETVQYNPIIRERRMERRIERRIDRRMDRREFRREVRQDRRDYYNGYRGYRDRRPGHRYYNGMWFPLGAFAAGAIIGGAVSQSQPAVRYGGNHAEWCLNRYRSYRPGDNTFQPFNGPRQRCVSPYS